VSRTVGAIVVDHDVGPLLTRCVQALLTDGVDRVVVVENGSAGSVEDALDNTPAELVDRVDVVRPGRNLGYGAGVNRGLAVLAGQTPAPDVVLVSNPDVIVHSGAIAGLADALEDHPSWAVVGPRIFTDAGDVYPSVRNFPSFLDAAGHALLALFKPDNPYTRRYNPGTPEGEVVVPAGWVSGSCFMARRQAFEELGGFDEAYFMYAEEMDLCWRAHQAGWGVGFAGKAAVTHVHGVSTARHPYRMIAAHHRSALRFTVRTTSGWRRAALPFAAMVLGVRMVMALVRQAATR
jgi:N-acetylglucosaminyl-diphospho-decaprenol L-rhamnosyltransferase